MSRTARTGLVVVGDALLDRDVRGHVDRLSPDAPVPVLDEETTLTRPGGAALAACLAARDGEQVSLIAPLGHDPAGEEVRSLVSASGVQLIDVASPGPTPEKIRLLADGRPMLRLDRGGSASSPCSLPEEALQAVEDGAVVLVSDYGRGVAEDSELRAVLARRRRPTLWDPHPRGPDPVPRTTLVTPNLPEIRGRFGAPGSPRGSTSRADSGMRAIAQAASAARSAWKAHAVAATLGADGVLLVDGDGPPLAIPAGAAGGGDPCGAGDCFAAAVATGLLNGALVSEAVIAAVDAASRFVAAGGAHAFSFAPAEAEDRCKTEPAPRPGANDALTLARSVKAAGGIVVVAGGCFDLLHAGHVAMLESARRLGDCLIVAINSDESVRRLKGPGRPVVPQADRAALLAALSCVDAVAVFEEDSPIDLLMAVRPDVFAKGGDYSARSLPEASVLATWGGQAVVLPYLSGRSTSGLLQLAGELP